jgi:hypothetical protein
MNERACSEEDPYIPPVAPLSANDPDPCKVGSEHPGPELSLLPRVKLMHFVSLVNLFTAVFLLVFALLTCLWAWFNRDRIAWQTIGNRFLYSYWAERLVVLPLFALFLLDLGRGLKRLSDESRTAQARLSAGLVIGYVIVRGVLGKSGLFEIVDRVALVLASLLTVVFGVAHVAFAYFFTSQNLLSLTRGQDRRAVTRMPGYPPGLGPTGMIGSLVVGLATSLGIFQVTAPLTYEIASRILQSN